MYKIYPGVLELGYKSDLKSDARKGLSVQIAPSGPFLLYSIKYFKRDWDGSFMKIIILALLIFVLLEIIRSYVDYPNKYEPDLITPILNSDKELSSVLKYDADGNKLLMAP